MKRLRIRLEDFDARQNQFAKIAFTGNRGCGKSTELFRLEHDLSDRFWPLHLAVPEALESDFDYTDLFLWLVDAVARSFADSGMPLAPPLVDNVVEWFAEHSQEDVKKFKAEVELQTAVEVKAKVGWPWLSLGLLTKLKSMVTGSTERRETIRRNLQRDAGQLVSRVNLLLDNAHTTLEQFKKPPNLLIVQDNLDRLSTTAAVPLFFTHADRLKATPGHVIYTVPIALVMAPGNIGGIFEDSFTMPMVKVTDRHGAPFTAGVDALTTLVAGRIDPGAVFTEPEVPRYLSAMSGGSVRDLIRMLNYAYLSARVANKDRIDTASAKEAVTKLRIDFERLLVPRQVYFPILATIHQTKHDYIAPQEQPDPKEVESARARSSRTCS